MDYRGSSSGPDIITIGHNPFVPDDLGVAKSICLSFNTEGGGSRRGAFIDEVLYDRLCEDTVPMSGFVLRQHSPKLSGCRYGEGILKDIYGSHHIDANLFRMTKSTSINKVLDVQKMIKLKRRKSVAVRLSNKTKSNEPYARQLFYTCLDPVASHVVESQSYMQDFYESRIASVERYMAFCVMFHAMAASVSKPILRAPWDISKSQSNLRTNTSGRTDTFMHFSAFKANIFS